MARKASMDDAGSGGKPEKKTFDKAGAVAAIKEAISLQVEQSEAAGAHGKYIKEVTEKLGVGAASFGFAKKLQKMDENKRQSALGDLLKLADSLGHFDQADAFGDAPVDLMREIVKRFDNGKPATGDTLN
jgi:hypothetical protein